MARDRWADVRNEQPSQPSYTDAPNYQPRTHQPYGGSSNSSGRGSPQQYGGAYTQPSNQYTRAQQHNVSEIELGTRTGGGLDSFLQQAEGIQRNIQQIGQNTSDIQGLHQRAIVETDQRQLSFLTQQIDSITDQNNELVQSTRAQIRNLSNIRATNAGDARVRSTQQKALAKKLMEAAQQYQQVQQQAKSAYRQQMTRQYAIARPGASREEIEAAVDGASGPIFQQEIMTSRVGEQRRALEAVRTRHDELLRIEQSITELFELFQEMQALLEQQGETINAIETHVEETNRAVEDGSKQMTQAVTSAKNARKTKRWILIVCIVLLVIIAIILYFVLQPYFKCGGQFNPNCKTDTNNSQSPAPVTSTTAQAVPAVSPTVVAGAQLTAETIASATRTAAAAVTRTVLRTASPVPSATSV
ncbi:Plasma membrane t-SNARE, secretory vesicle fusion [Rhizophlyctis rosea]|uniref:Plasma membrane t-SNARE, secretory vesicle fusion n=1 Tax=Rhizophlyctis rosea TaxID=64517 RepID=A0AAD5S611_9FUNG|nr:Plasma membrane t-SNARE, secretory vesicle fusion [Rhizophlyctis rosea]